MGLLCDDCISGRVIERHGDMQNIALVRCLNKVWRKGGGVENFLVCLSNDKSG